VAEEELDRYGRPKRQGNAFSEYEMAHRNRAAAFLPPDTANDPGALARVFSAVGQATGGQAGLNVAEAASRGAGAGEALSQGLGGVTAGQGVAAGIGGFLGGLVGPEGIIPGALLGSFVGSLVSPAPVQKTAGEVARNLNLPSTEGVSLKEHPLDWLKGFGTEVGISVLTDPASFVTGGERTLLRLTTAGGTKTLTKEGADELGRVATKLKATEGIGDRAAQARARQLVGRALNQSPEEFLKDGAATRRVMKAIDSESTADVMDWVQSVKRMEGRPALGLELPLLPKRLGGGEAVVPGSAAALQSFSDFSKKIGKALGDAVEKTNFVPVRLGEGLTKKSSKLLTNAAKAVRQNARSLFGDEGLEAFERAALKGRTAFQDPREATMLEKATRAAGIADPIAFFDEPKNLLRVDLSDAGRLRYGYSRAALAAKDSVDWIGRNFGLKKLPPGFEQLKRQYVIDRAVEITALNEEYAQPLRTLTTADRKVVLKTIDQAGAVQEALLGDAAKTTSDVIKDPSRRQPAIDMVSALIGREAKNRDLYKFYRDQALEKGMSAFKDQVSRLPDELALHTTKTWEGFQKLMQLDQEAGALRAGHQFYVPHVFQNKDAIERLYGLSGGGKRTLRGAQIERLRTPEGRFLIPTIESAKQMGLDPVEDIADLMSIRISASVGARASRNFYREVGDQFGRPLRDFVKETVTTDTPVMAQIKMGHEEVLAQDAARTKDGVYGESELDRMRRQTGATIADVKSAPEVGRYVTIEGIPELTGVRLPAEVAAAVKDTAGGMMSRALENPVYRAIAATNQFFKASVTGWFPAFHKRNIVNDLYNASYVMGLGALNPWRHMHAIRILNGADGVIHTAFGPRTYEEIRDAFRTTGLKAAGGPIDTADVGLKGVLEKFGRLPLAAQRGYSAEARMNLFLGLLEDGTDARAAAERVTEHLFDYNDLTDFERTWMRQVVPFYTWSRKNIPLQVKTALDRPFLPIATSAIYSAAGPEAKERAQMPEYLRDGLLVKTGTDAQGNITGLRGLDMPVEDLVRLVNSEGFSRGVQKEVLGQMSPILELPLELATGREFFTGRTTDERKRVSKWVDSVPGLREWLNLKEDRRGNLTADGDRLLAIQGFSLGRVFSTLNRLTNPDVDPIWKAMDVVGVTNVHTDRLRDMKMRQVEKMMDLYEEGDLEMMRIPYAPRTPEAAALVQSFRAGEQRPKKASFSFLGSKGKF
jgi:hypothetical protein